MLFSLAPVAPVNVPVPPQLLALAPSLTPRHLSEQRVVATEGM